MIIQLNGSQKEVTQDVTLETLLAEYQLERDTVIIELNRNLLDSATPLNTPLQDGDIIEFVRFVGGG